MPFIPAIIGAALIGGGTSIAASLINKKGSSSSSSNISPEQQQLINTQKNIADFGLAEGKPLIGKATASYDDAMSFYKTLLHGSDDELMKLLNVQDYTKSADESEAQAYNLLGRTGSRAAVLGNTATSRSAEVNKILAQLRLNAPGQIANIGQAYANLGVGLVGAGGNAATQASNILFGQQQLAQEAADRRSQLIGSIIGTAGSALGVYVASRNSGKST